MPDLSILMQIYNGEKFLDKSINSVLCQSYTNFNLILVDDGSQDHSVELCRKYQQADRRVQVVVSPENRYTLVGKLELFESLLAEYVMLIDVDDWLEENAAEEALNAMRRSKADIVVFDYYFNDSEPSKYEIEMGQYDNMEAVTQLMLDKHVRSYYWNKIYRKEVFVNGLREAPNDRECFTDLPLMPYIFKHAQKVVTIDKKLYHYFANPENYSNSTKKSKLHFHLANSYWHRIRFCEKDYPDLLYDTGVLDIAFANSLGAWRELMIDKKWDCAKKLRKSMKNYRKLLNRTKLPLVKKVIIFVLTI